MAKKAMTSMKDENQELQKQIGCISGFFQLFDRHRFLTSSNNNHNISNHGETGNKIKELNNATQKAKVKNVKVARENQQSSTESSSGISMSSSSCSSSMSSLEFNRTIQIEPPSISPMKITENSKPEVEMKQLGNERHQRLDFHDIVKDSMHIDSQRLLVKTLAREEKKVRILKHIDSPRPMTAWDSPRLSYDGRDIQSTIKSATKHKELPRFSLDSKERSIKSFNDGPKNRNLLKGPQRVCGGSNTIVKQMEEPEASKRPSSVVAKLMGLEAFPEWGETCDICNTDKDETFAGSRTSDEYMQQKDSECLRTVKGTTLLQSRRDGSITNATPYSQLQASKSSESSLKVSNRSLSVYGEIEKRMADLEFKKSGKDLRALKQILEAMHRYKESLDTTSDQASNSPYDNRSNSSVSESLNVQSPRARLKNPTSVTVARLNSQGSKSPIVIAKPTKVAKKTNNSSTEMFKSSGSKVSRSDLTNGMLVDKFGRQTTKGSPEIKHVKDPISPSFHSMSKSNKMRTSKVPQVIVGENNTNSGIMVETKSPRLQKKFGLERRSPPSSPSSDISSNRRQQNRQSMELSSPRTTSRQKISTLQERNESFGEMSYQRRDCKQVKGVSRSDIEVIHRDHSDMINSNSIQLKENNENNVEKDSSKESFMAETIVAAEQPSPVSVLDASFYREDPPSPVKRKTNISKDLDEVLNTYDTSEEDSEDLALSSNTNTKVNFSNETSDIDLIIHSLVQILQQFELNDDERFMNFSDYKDPDHKYISEILLASRLLASPGSSQALHSSGYPINPMLFLALEKLKTNKMHVNIANMNNHEKMQRKLIFDVVNEMLFQKLISESSWQTYQQKVIEPKGQHLSDMLCTKIDKLQHKNRNVSLANEDEYLTSILLDDLAQHPTITECYNEIPNVVLDIERLIFKDLITEIVRTEK